LKDIIILGSLNKSRQRRCVFDIYSLCPTLTAAMGMGGGMMPYIIEVNRRDIGVLYERK